VDVLAGAGVPVVPSPATGKGCEAVLWPLTRELPSASGLSPFSYVSRCPPDAEPRSSKVNERPKRRGGMLALLK
jgi:hypothetical protein